jgi:hypothetical protein
LDDLRTERARHDDAVRALLHVARVASRRARSSRRSSSKPSIALAVDDVVTSISTIATVSSRPGIFPSSLKRPPVPRPAAAARRRRLIRLPQSIQHRHPSSLSTSTPSSSPSIVLLPILLHRPASIALRAPSRALALDPRRDRSRRLHRRRRRRRRLHALHVRHHRRRRRRRRRTRGRGGADDDRRATTTEDGRATTDFCRDWTTTPRTGRGDACTLFTWSVHNSSLHILES